MRRTVEEIQADIAAIAEDWAAGVAMYEPTGVGGLTMFDCFRKNLLSKIGMTVIETAEEKGVKLPTEKQFDAMTHSTTQYVDFIEKSFEARRRYIELNARMSALKNELALAEMHERYADVEEF